MATLPHMAHITPADVPYASSGSWTLSALSSGLGGMRLLSGGTQNDYIEWPICAAAGTWRLTLIHLQDTNRGIYTPSIDGTALTTIDGYAGSTTTNVVSQVSSIALTAGNHLLRFTMATKNASSSSYVAGIQHVCLLRTGD